MNQPKIKKWTLANFTVAYRWKPRQKKNKDLSSRVEAGILDGQSDLTICNLCLFFFSFFVRQPCDLSASSSLGAIRQCSPGAVCCIIYFVTIQQLSGDKQCSHKQFSLSLNTDIIGHHLHRLNAYYWISRKNSTVRPDVSDAWELHSTEHRRWNH